MGSDQSSQNNQPKRKGKSPKRSHSARTDKDNEFIRSSSPRPSICSDTDIPYVSYTTTKPISEEIQTERKFKWTSEAKPRARDKIINREKRDNKAKSVGSIVTVKAACEIPTIEKDPLFQRLQEIPPFTPIIRETPGVPWTKNPELTEKIDPTPFLRIVFLYQQRLKRHGEVVRSKQIQISNQLKESDEDVQHIMNILNTREKNFTSFVDAFSKIGDLAKNLSACHYSLNRTIEAIETLNNMLSIEDRLEPFVWTTG